MQNAGSDRTVVLSNDSIADNAAAVNNYFMQEDEKFKAVLNYKLLHVPFAQQQRLFNFFFAAFKGAILNLNAGV